MTVRAINTANDAEFEKCLANWNAQAEQLNTTDRKAFDIWTPESGRLFLAQAFTHRIDDTNDSFAVATYDPLLNEYDFVGYLTGTLGVARCMRALCQLLPRTAIVRGDVITAKDRKGGGTLVSQTMRNYYQTRYTPSVHPELEGVTRYRSTAANIVSRA